MKRRKKISTAKEMVGRQEFAVWLGRAMSTSEVTLRVVVQLLDVISLQQQTIQAVFEGVRASHDDRSAKEVQKEFEQDSSAKILEQLADVRKELRPVLRAVDKACRQLKDMI